MSAYFRIYVGISPPAIDWIWLCSVSICSLMARNWRSWFALKLVSLVMAEFVMLGEVLSQSRKWPVSVTGGRSQWPSRFDFTVGGRLINEHLGGGNCYSNQRLDGFPFPACKAATDCGM